MGIFIQQEHFKEDYMMWMTMLCICTVFKNTNFNQMIGNYVAHETYDEAMFEYLSLPTRTFAINGNNTRDRCSITIHLNCS